jgi:hypothetical protein
VSDAEGPLTAALPSPRRHPRHLIVLRAGDASLHRPWVAGPARDFDLFISDYGSLPGQHRDGADYYEHRPGPKWPALAALIDQHDWLLEEYDSFWFPDDDLAADTGLLNRMFAFFCAYQLHLAQPALTRNSYGTWKTLRQDPRCQLRYTGFVEVMAPLFSRAALQACRHTFAESPSGWGLDWVWPMLCRRAGLDRLAVIDATPVQHTRPVGGGDLYRNHRRLDPRADAARVVQRYGVQEVRAVAQYSIHRRVLALPLPVHQRLVFWLKRLNGRRKHHGRQP